MNSNELIEQLRVATARLASETPDEATIRRNQTIADAAAHIAAQDARIEALEGALRRCFRGETHAVRNERVLLAIKEHSKAALGGEHGG